MDGTADGSLLVPLTVVEEFPGFEAGASRTRHVKCDDGREYAIKAADSDLGNPYLPANEWIAARLAVALDLPIIPHAVVCHESRLCFGSRWLGRELVPFITPELLAQCRNVDTVHDLVIFDAWIINGDRHPQNIWVHQQIGGPDDGACDLLLPDHGHAVIPPGSKPETLAANWLAVPAQLSAPKLPAVQATVSSLSSLRRAVAAIRTLPDDSIRTLVRSTPEEWLAAEEADAVVDFLLARRLRLPLVFAGADALYPALRGGQL